MVAYSAVVVVVVVVVENYSRLNNRLSIYSYKEADANNQHPPTRVVLYVVLARAAIANIIW